MDVAIQDVNGATALTWAASQGHLEVVNMLLNSKSTTSRNHASRCAAWALERRKRTRIGCRGAVNELVVDGDAPAVGPGCLVLLASGCCAK
jgi:ankyrin repeat protein